MSQIPKSPAISNPTHYQILDIAPSLLRYTSTHEKDLTPQLLKRAYHRALLRHHPDKAGSSPNPGEPPVKSLGPSHPDTAFTIDQISSAYNTLKNPQARKDYDTFLRQNLAASTDASGPGAASNGDGALFQTGVEVIDLDDLDYDEATGRWFMSCRCGNERGFEFGEDVLEEGEGEGEVDAGSHGRRQTEREVFVGCMDCSLWLRVQYEVQEE